MLKIKKLVYCFLVIIPFLTMSGCAEKYDIDIDVVGVWEVMSSGITYEFTTNGELIVTNPSVSPSQEFYKYNLSKKDRYVWVNFSGGSGASKEKYSYAIVSFDGETMEWQNQPIVGSSWIQFARVK